MSHFKEAMPSLPTVLFATALTLMALDPNPKQGGSVGFLVRLMPACRTGQSHRSGTDFMGNAVVLELHSSRVPTINGDVLRRHSWVWYLEDIFSTRASKVLLLAPDDDVQMEQVLALLDRLKQSNIVDQVILLTPRQGADIRDETCVMQ